MGQETPEMLTIQDVRYGLKYTVNSKIFARVKFHETSHLRSFMKIKPSGNAEITQSVTDIGKSCPSGEFLALQICLLMLFPKIKF